MWDLVKLISHPRGGVSGCDTKDDARQRHCRIKWSCTFYLRVLASPHSSIKTEAGKLTQKGMTHMLTCQCSVDVGRRELRSFRFKLVPVDGCVEKKKIKRID